MGIPEDNAERVRSGLAAWAAGDVAETLATLTDDVEVFVPPELGNAGSFHGRDAFIRWTQEWEEAWSENQIEVIDAQPVGKRHVVATVRSRAVGRGSGIEVENVLGWVLTVHEDGMCDYLSLQPDVEHALALAREREEAG